MCACSAHRTATGRKICSLASEPVCVSSCRVCRRMNAVPPALQVVPIGASHIRPAQKPCAVLHPAARPRTIQSNRVIPRGASHHTKPHRGTLPTGAAITPCTAKPFSRRSSPVGARACTIIPSRRVISFSAPYNPTAPHTNRLFAEKTGGCKLHPPVLAFGFTAWRGLP